MGCLRGAELIYAHSPNSITEADEQLAAMFAHYTVSTLRAAGITARGDGPADATSWPTE